MYRPKSDVYLFTQMFALDISTEYRIWSGSALFTIQSAVLYRIRPNYCTYPYKRTVKQFRSLQITASVLFEGKSCGYPFELH